MSGQTGQGGAAIAVNHQAGFFESDGAVVAAAVGFLAEGLARGEAVMIVAEGGHETDLLDGLADAGNDVAAARAAGSLVVLDATDTLDALMVGGRAAARLFDANVGSVVRRASRAGSGVCCFGEMVGLLWERGEVIEALHLEDLWNRLLAASGGSLLCGYPMRSGAPAGDEVRAYAEVCSAHSDVLDAPPLPTQRAVSVQLPALPLASAAARRFVDETLRSWGLDAVADDAALVATELATNAMSHAGSPFSLAVARVDQGIVLTVGDRSAAAPRPRVAGSGEQSGRGLGLVDALSTAWGCQQVPGGKLVWAELPLPTPAVAP